MITPVITFTNVQTQKLAHNLYSHVRSILAVKNAHTYILIKNVKAQTPTDNKRTCAQ